MDTLYFRKAALNISEFISLLSGHISPKEKPIIEEEMFKLEYNNVIEEMVKRS
jgi:hypothetical protein